MEGFTYNGIHCSTLNVEYIPDATDRWFQDAEFEIYNMDIDWKHGGYYFGNKVKIRSIEVKCYYEEITIAQREKIRHWLARNTSGKLIFDDKPFVYFNVRPESVVPGVLYNDNGKYSGTFTIQFIAHNPFGYLTRKSNGSSDNDGAENYCGIISTSLMPAAPGVSTREFMVYNPGTEACGMTVRISGTAGKTFMLLNDINKTSCRISALPTNNLILDISGETGRSVVYNSATPENYDNGYAYHDRGIVRLEPNESQTNVAYTKQGTSGSAIIIDVSSPGMIGDRILFNNASGRTGRVIATNDDHTRLTCTITGGSLPSSGTCTISSINRIRILEQGNNNTWVTPTNLTVNSIEIDYRPRLL